MTPPAQAETKKAKNAPLRRRMALAATSMALTLLLLEGAVRFTKRHVPFQPDPDLIRSLRPNVAGIVPSFETDENLLGAEKPIPSRPHIDGQSPTNNIGFRMADDVGQKREDERRVLLLGDSYTEADQLRGDRRFSHLLNQRLVAETAGGPERWRVLNGGIQNGSPAQYILQLRRWLDLVRPDIVIVALAPNDVRDDTTFEREYGFERDAGGAPLAPLARTRLKLLQGSYLLRYFHVALLRSGATSLYDLLFPPVVPAMPTPHAFDMLCYESPPTRALFEEKTGTYLKQIKAMVEAKGARFGVFLIHYMWVFDDEPYYAPAMPGVREEAEKLGCLGSHGAPYNTYTEAFLRGAGIAFHNPYEALVRAKRENPRRKLWHYVDYHFSPAGHRIMADEMHGFVERLRERTQPR